jgi:hypothetical protein
METLTEARQLRLERRPRLYGYHVYGNFSA